ncbi:MAG: hypothetical protein OEM91_06665 [Hyphomicrobiales bacterium]|nr:hypothetical protein [Hyphomicrobiales bacterium]
MRDADCVEFLQWALPQLNMRWPGFRKVRRQVCKRVARRMKKLDLETIEQYRSRLVADRDEWLVLDAACRITISRFYRDKYVFDLLGRDMLPALAERANNENRSVRIWCAGCASGEEVYTLAILWDIVVRPVYPDVELKIVGTDADPVMIARAEQACYSHSTLKDMPERYRALAFAKSNGEFCVKLAYRSSTRFQLQDIREEQPEGFFDLVLCRNLAFTYFALSSQQSVLGEIKARLRPCGYLLVGAHEQVPMGDNGLHPIVDCREILQFRNSINDRGLRP